MAVAPPRMAAPQRAMAAHVARPMLHGRRLSRTAVARSVGRCAARWPLKLLRDGRPSLTDHAQPGEAMRAGRAWWPAKGRWPRAHVCAGAESGARPCAWNSTMIGCHTRKLLRRSMVGRRALVACGRASRLARRCARPCFTLGAMLCAAVLRAWRDVARLSRANFVGGGLRRRTLLRRCRGG
ncbi:putative tetraacyldisaccharide 4'-kinase, mitochondrial [Dorcoceras hygrometricum]|uniref:Putative tetraacyldisaccharide 4'-kinase, mitochondrial n=1 Tax=Dorcoceras hygrometricum TaxID=472368 RepID=A0A2Z6ZWN9_9LAMI|nr:putative tetraacyldisaccharide 4'-kinase, mitochondrial [Dorcoceras hygrometricum]